MGSGSFRLLSEFRSLCFGVEEGLRGFRLRSLCFMVEELERV